MERSRTTALKKQLSAAKIECEDRMSKHQLALDDLNIRLKQTMEGHDKKTDSLLQDAAEKHAKNTMTLIAEHRKEVAAEKEACKKEIENMAAFFERDNSKFRLKHGAFTSDLRLQMMQDARTHKQETKTLKQTIKAQESLLHEVKEELAESKEEHSQARKAADHLRLRIQAQASTSTNVLATKDFTISNLRQRLQETERKLDKATADMLSQDSVYLKDSNKLTEKVAGLEQDVKTLSHELNTAETNAQILRSQLHQLSDSYNASKLQVEQQAIVARRHATRTVLKLARMRKTLARRSKHTTSSPVIGHVTASLDTTPFVLVDGQVTAPDTTTTSSPPVDGHATALDTTTTTAATITAATTTTTISPPVDGLVIAPDTTALDGQEMKHLETAMAELAICGESAKTTHVVQVTAPPADAFSPPAAVESSPSPAIQAPEEAVDPNHEIFNGGYNSSDFDDGSDLSSIPASEIANWEEEYGPDTGDYGDYNFDVESEQSSSDKDSVEGSESDDEDRDDDDDHDDDDDRDDEDHDDEGAEDEDGEDDGDDDEDDGDDDDDEDGEVSFGEFYETLKEGQARVEAASLKKTTDELEAHTREAKPGPSSCDTLPAERKILAPKSLKKKRKYLASTDHSFGGG
ncbi:Alpha-(1,6)-fucosyltransferase [Xylographa trunciseda]|nr:Alpha-(1,6)-fucosyltransferase [Xylographa trunciseda]